jgi:hypothetical protein
MGNVRSSWVKLDQMGSSRDKWGQEEPKGVNLSQVRLSRIKWGLVGKWLVIGQMSDRFGGERLGERPVWRALVIG